LCQGFADLRNRFAVKGHLKDLPYGFGRLGADYRLAVFIENIPVQRKYPYCAAVFFYPPFGKIAVLIFFDSFTAFNQKGISHTVKILFAYKGRMITGNNNPLAWVGFNHIF
jgi:hypothetical protein